MPKRELVDIELYQFHETERAYLVSDSLDDAKAVWIPKTHAERGDRKASGGGANQRSYEVFYFTLPEWLAIEKKLV